MDVQSLAGDWQFRQLGTEEWLPAQVPGGVHTDLMAAGRILDPFVADHEKRVQWVAESDWEYRHCFNTPPELMAKDRLFLVCDGLDTLASVALNGQELGRTENMFRQYEWDVTSLLHAQDEAGHSNANELHIVFYSPIRYIREKQANRPLLGVFQAIPGAPYLRKAPCQFGWDWGPQLPPIGIWKDVRLEGYSGSRLEDVHLRQFHSDGEVLLQAHVTIQRWSETPLVAVMEIVTPDGEILEGKTAITSKDEALVEVAIPNPKLWWPVDYGAHPLYQVQVSVRSSDPMEAAPLDLRTYQVGLRTVELHQEEDAWGQSFIFIVNGVPVFAKGSNWIPADSFPTRITDEHLEALIRSAIESHQNMLRVWGGGFYEEERFYDLCDRYGILVWQDFIFSCSVYPLTDGDFLENVRIEVEQNIRRLRHRTCLALWCGNNEIEWLWDFRGWDQDELQDLKDAYNEFFHHTLRLWCTTKDPDHSYWPSSPSSGTPFEEPNSQQRGDAHYWDVWHGGKPFTAYRDQFPRFMSEFGFQALPSLATIRTFAREADWDMTSSIMESHQKNEMGNYLIMYQMNDLFQSPKDFPSLVYLSMVLQAEGIRYGVEHWRRCMDRVAGTLYWQLNDCWPVVSWSSLDYFGRWKALHYAARRFYAPLMLSIEDQPPLQRIHVISDLCQPWLGSVRWSLETLGGDVMEAGEEKVEAAPLSSTHVCTIDCSQHVSDDNRRKTIFVAELWQGEQRVAMQTATFVSTKQLSLTESGMTIELHNEDGRLAIEIVSRSFARLVELSLEDTDVNFNDNYFDLPAGRKVIVTCPLPVGWSLEQAKAALKIRTVFDTYDHAIGA
jgi:beta-mannosidase